MIRVAPARAALVVAYMALILTLTTMPGEDLSRLGIGRFLLDLGHIPLFAGLALVSFWATGGPLWSRLGAVALFCVVFAGVGEWLQRFSSRRVPALGDFGADCLGIGAGLVIAVALSLIPITLNSLRRPSNGGASR